jgi:hypothetical protein
MFAVIRHYHFNPKDGAEIEELLALWRNHDPCYLLFLDLLIFLVVLRRV